jgi:hypothetical protein
MTKENRGDRIMIQILSNNLFQAINTDNQKLLGFLIDDNCILTHDENPILGKDKVIKKLNQLFLEHDLSILNSVKDDENTQLFAYKLEKNNKIDFGSLIIRQNENKKICFLKNVLISHSQEELVG